MKEYITVGQIINTHGLKGEIKIYPLTDDIKRFRKLKNVYIDNKETKITWCKLQSDKIILKLEGIDTIEAAQKLKEKYIEIKREDAVKLPEGRYFITDIMECTVFDETGKELGKVTNVIQTGSNDVYSVKGKDEDILIPALKSIVTKIDIENQTIVIKPLDTWQ